jgi:hypothetical protein
MSLKTLIVRRDVRIRELEDVLRDLAPGMSRALRALEP